MANPQIIEGTGLEIAHLLQSENFAAHNLRVIIQEDDSDDLVNNLPAPPFTVRSKEHLDTLLRDGLTSPAHPVNTKTWDKIRAEVRRRHEARQAVV